MQSENGTKRGKYSCEPFFDFSQNLLGILDPNFNLVAANPEFTKLLGRSQSELLGRSILDLFHGDDRAVAKRGLVSLMERSGSDRFHSDSRLVKSDGQFIWVDCRCWLDSGTNLLYFVGNDKSEAKRQETYLREIEKCAGVGGWEIDLATGRLFWSDETHHIIGTDPKTYVPNLADAYDFYVPESRQKIKDLVSRAMKDFKPWETEAWIVRNREKIPVRVASKVELKDGKITRVYGTFQDITEQKKTELELIEREQRLNLVISTGNIGFWSLDMRTNRVHFSERWFRLLGLDPGACKQEMDSLTERIHPDDLPEYLRQMEEVRTTSSAICRKTLRMRHANGNWLEILSQGQVVSHGEAGEAHEFIGILTDVTIEGQNQRKIADQIQKSIVSQKLAALGEMAAGIAHEINNPLAVIAGRSATVLRRLNSGSYDVAKVAKEISLIEETAFRIAKIVSGLNQFARESELTPRSPEFFSTILEDTLAFCAERFRINGVELAVKDTPEKISLNCASLQISQVLLNLFNNAYDAVQSAQNKWVQVRVERRQKLLVVSVTDSGPKISPEIQSKMMNPFFTTKDIGKGTGLGLSISKGIIESHGGRFYYQAEAANTCFVFELPVE